MTKLRPAQSIVEYTIILALVALVVIVSLSALGGGTFNSTTAAASAFGDPTAETGPTMHVSSIGVKVRGRRWRKVTGTVLLVDEEGEAIRGATVMASWFVNGVSEESGVARTDRRGRARFYYRSRELNEGDIVRLAVTDVTATDYQYDPDDNVESADQITVP